MLTQLTQLAATANPNYAIMDIHLFCAIMAIAVIFLGFFIIEIVRSIKNARAERRIKKTEAEADRLKASTENLKEWREYFECMKNLLTNNSNTQNTTNDNTSKTSTKNKGRK